MFHVFLEMPGQPVKECIASRFNRIAAEREYQLLVFKRELAGTGAEVTLKLNDTLVSSHSFDTVKA